MSLTDPGDSDWSLHSSCLTIIALLIKQELRQCLTCLVLHNNGTNRCWSHWFTLLSSFAPLAYAALTLDSLTREEGFFSTWEISCIKLGGKIWHSHHLRQWVSIPSRAQTATEQLAEWSLWGRPSWTPVCHLLGCAVTTGGNDFHSGVQNQKPQ